MSEESHGFCTREAWTEWLTNYNAIISELNERSYELVQSELPADEWIALYQHNSAQIREAYCRNEQMLDRHIRWFTRTPGRWTREIADPLLAALFRYITRIQDLGAAHEIAESLLDFYAPLGDEPSLMKCCLVRAFCLAFLDPIHLLDEVDADCTRAREIYERHFSDLTPEDRSMGLSIYDLLFDHTRTLLKLGRATAEELDRMIECHDAAVRATELVIAEDQGYEFNTILPDFDHYLGFAALCLSPEDCTPDQANTIYQAAERRYHSCKTEPGHSEFYRVRIELVYGMAQRLVGLCSDQAVLERIRTYMGSYAQSLFNSGTFSQHALEAVEAIQLSTETLTRGGKYEPALYRTVQSFFIRYFSTRPYTSLADYICASYNYCYILTVLSHQPDRQELLRSLLKLTMFRQVQTAMHSIMVAELAGEIVDTLVRRKPELLVGLPGASSAAEVQAHAQEYHRYLYCGALLHDVGKLVCSSVINAQCHRLGDLEFRVLKMHPITGREMLDHLPALAAFRDIAFGHHKSFDGSGGYPAEYSRTTSPQKIFIDIITVCDSLDAATDNLGRNYAAAKDFSTVMDELRGGRGTRYSGDIVDLIDHDVSLQARLRHLLEEGRREVYYTVHKTILEESTGQHGPNTHTWQFDLSLPASID